MIKKQRTTKLTIRLAPVPMKLLRQLFESGLYGFTIEQAAELILLEGLRQRMSDPVLSTPKRVR